MITRRRIVLALGAAALAPFAASAQQQPAARRIGFLITLSTQRSSPWALAFESRLHELGWIEGKNLTVDFLNAEGKVERFSDLATELVRRKVDVICAAGPEAPLRAARQATSTIPIVFGAVDYDPVARGYVAGLARPGGNITGVFANQLELTAKRLDLLKQAFPKISRVAVLWDAISADQLKAAQAAAAALGIRLQALELRNFPYDYNVAFRAAAGEKAQAIMPLMSPLKYRGQAQIVDHASRNRLPAISGLPGFAQAGGLIEYGASLPVMFRRLAEMTDSILKGAKPGDLPIEQPTKFELVVNLKTAKTLGLKIPALLMQRADQVIE